MTTQNYRLPYAQTKMAILDRETYTECAEVVDVYGQGCNYATKQGVNGFQVDFDIELENKLGEKKQFHIVFQTDDRSDNIKAYNGYEMSTAHRFGCDADESRDALEFMDYEQNWLDELQEIAERDAKSWLDDKIEE